MKANKLKRDLIVGIANELFRFNIENKKYKVSDEFSVDGKKYSVEKEVYASLKRQGLVSLVKLLQWRGEV